MNSLFGTIMVALCVAQTGAALAAEPVAGGTSDTKKNAGEGYQVIKKVKLGGDGSWDYLSIDSAGRRLYIGRSNRVMVVDIDAEKIVAEIGGMQGVHGVTVVPERTRDLLPAERRIWSALLT